MAKRRSTRFGHELDVGVKCSSKRGWAAGRRWIACVLCVEELSGSSVNPKRAAVARFAQRVIETRGHVSDADLAAVRGAGYTDPQILAIVTLAVRALLTNYLNNVNLTDVDISAPDLA
jgi:alkylhydroperoxidase family enzyme